MLEGSLGCPNCRDRFPVRKGFGDLRAPPRTPLEDRRAKAGAEGPGGDSVREAEAVPGGPASDGADVVPGRATPDGADAEEAIRLGALLGVTRGPAHLALVGPLARYAPDLAERLEEVEVVAVSEEGVGREEREGVSRIVARPGLPFFDGTLRGVALHGGEDAALVQEAMRVVSPGSRVVVTGASDASVSLMEAAGLTVLVDEAGVVVGER